MILSRAGLNAQYVGRRNRFTVLTFRSNWQDRLGGLAITRYQEIAYVAVAIFFYIDCGVECIDAAIFCPTVMRNGVMGYVVMKGRMDQRHTDGNI